MLRTPTARQQRPRTAKKSRLQELQYQLVHVIGALLMHFSSFWRARTKGSLVSAFHNVWYLGFVIGTQVTATSGKIYTVIKEIGRGGFGVVYLVQDEAGAQHALKILSPASDPEVQLSFEQELQSTAGLHHRNILSVHDHGSVALGADRALFTVAEYCPDGDYRRVVDEYARTRPPLDKVLDDFHQILDGLEVLHTKILHRDLKPENVLRQGDVKKLADFGLAKFVDQATRTLTFKGLGTPRYMAPEVWDRRGLTAATDLYAIGVMLFEALTGTAPFTGTDIIQIRERHLYSPAPRAKSLNADIPDFLDGIVKKMLAKDPRDRYQSARDANDALRAVARESGNSPGQEIAARMRKHHDAKEAEELRILESYNAAQDAQARNRYKQEELLALFDEVMSEINASLEEVKITIQPLATGRAYIFGNRTLLVHFFDSGALFRDPWVPGRLEVLRKRHVVHAGYIEIAENGEDREGWNIVLVRPSDKMYGDWLLVETRVHPLTGRSARFEPIATKAQLFADNLACHWRQAMHTFVLKDKPLEKGDVYQVFGVFIPKV
jgi:serine/threonine protein kinase